MDLIINVLEGLTIMIGVQGPITLDVNIYEHLDYENFEEKNDLITIGEKGRKINFQDILVAFRKINADEGYKNALESGRSYMFEGISRTRKDPSKFNMIWGS
jgi:hypothetical protein